MNKEKIIVWFSTFLVISAILACAYLFFYKKSYDFTVEAPCSKSTATCFVRQCDNEECPPNQLEEYRVFKLTAADFPKCSNDSCLNECLMGDIRCTEVVCGESADDLCVVHSDL